MKVRIFAVSICTLVALTAESGFCDNSTANQSKSPPKSWLRGLYDKLTSPAVKPVTIYDSRPQPVPGKSVVIYYGNQPEVVSLTATNRAGLVKPFAPTK